MINHSRFNVYGLYPQEGHRFIRSIDTLPFEGYSITYYDDSSIRITLDDLRFLYNTAIETISYYKQKCVELQYEASEWESEYYDLLDKCD